MENNTAKHFVLQLGSIITLYLSISFLLVLLFSVINLIYPDAAERYWEIESASQSVRLGIAMLVVFFPVYLYVTRMVNENRRKETNTLYLGLTKWLMYLSLLIGGGVLMGDLVAVILAFLNGELTTRFLLKAAVLLVVVGAAFYYYLQDTKGYWLAREKSSVYYALGMTVVVVASLVTGFFHTETPTQVRELRLDETQVADLQNIQYKIEEFMSLSSSTLPADLAEAYNGFEMPIAPEDRPAYTYELTAKGFNLCATFSRDSSADKVDVYAPVFDIKMPIKNANNWSYKEGMYCFERVTK
jgi:Domain of unknown function (DUF5671)